MYGKFTCHKVYRHKKEGFYQYFLIYSTEEGGIKTKARITKSTYNFYKKRGKHEAKSNRFD